MTADPLLDAVAMQAAETWRTLEDAVPDGQAELAEDIGYASARTALASGVSVDEMVRAMHRLSRLGCPMMQEAEARLSDVLHEAAGHLVRVAESYTSPPERPRHPFARFMR